MSERKFPGCLKYGCFGCLAAVALGVGLILLLAAIRATTETPEPNQVEREARHKLPEPPPLPPAAAADQPDAKPVAPLPETVDFPLGDEEPAPGVLVLDLSMGRFTIRPGPADEPLRVDADFDEASFELVEKFSQNDDDSWIYEVSFDGKGGWLGMLFHGGGDAGRNHVEITVPRGHPVEIIGQIGMGESETDLGGLWVRRVDLEYSAGDHFLEFREPLAFPMEELLVDGSMGNLEMRNLGEASPARVEVDHGMGQLLVDLEGAWRRDATVDVRFSMGECRLWLPKDARVDFARMSVGMGEKHIDSLDDRDLPPDAPTLTLDLSGSMGELRVEN